MLIGFMGKMGTGKTMAMTALATKISHDQKVPIYANYEVKGMKDRIKFMSEIWNLDDCILLLDEIWLTMDSREWGNQSNIKMTRFINQTRKKNIMVMYTTQHISQVEMRVRNATDILVYCEKKAGKHSQQYIDYQYGTIGKKLTIKDPSVIYPLYNTYEVLQPLK